MSWTRLSEKTSNSRPDRVSSTHAPNLLSMGQATVEADPTLSGFALWSAGSYSTEQAAQGAGSLKITASYDDEYIGFALNAIPATAGAYYTVHMAVHVGAVARGISLGFSFLDEVGVIGGGTWGYGIDPGDWSVLNVIWQAPPGTAYAEVNVFGDDPIPEGESAYFDEFAVYQGYEYEWYPPA